MMETRRQWKVISIPNENEKSKNSMIGKFKKNVNNEAPRAILGEIAGNRLANQTTDKFLKLSSITSGTLKSRLPVLKSGYSSISSSTINKSNVNKISHSSLKENNVPTQVNIKQPKVNNLKLLVDKTKSLKLSTKEKSVVKPVDIVDVDKNDGHNPFTVPMYAHDIHNYLKSLEKTHSIKEDYLKNRKITPKIRNVVVDWLVEVQQEYLLLQETLHIAVGIFDTYLQKKSEIDKSHVQLIGTTALFLASKYEEMMVPSASDFVYIASSIFTEKDLFQMEAEIFKAINFDLSKPISLHFLRRYSKVAQATGDQYTLAKYFIELALVHYSMCHFNPSSIAAAALYLGFFVTSADEKADGKLWTKTLEYYSGYTFGDFEEILIKLSGIVFNAKNSKFKAVLEKYSDKKFMKVSTYPQLYDARMKNLANSSIVPK